MEPPATEPDRFFAQILTELGLVPAERMAALLDEQTRREAAGDARPLGIVLVDEGILSPDQLSQALRLRDSAAAVIGPTRPDPNRADTRVSAPDVSPPGKPFGRYRLHEILGTGGMGVVWKAWDTELQRTVALKQIRPERAGGGEAIERFQREARVAARLRHPNIVAVHDVGVCDGTPYLTMDYIAGRTFSAALQPAREEKRAGGARGYERLNREITILAEVAGAVAHAHEHGVIHRDLKPGNILLDDAERPCVMDFGLAKEVAEGADAGGPRGSDLTQSGALLGTPKYMSPEQARADGTGIGAASDIWALGVILYEVLTGATPFEAEENPWGILFAVATKEPTRPRARNRRAPADLEAVCLKALEKEPARRYRSAAELAEELRRWLRGEPVLAKSPGPLARAARWVLRKKKIVLPAAAAALVLAAGLGWSWHTDREANARIEAARTRHRALVENIRRTVGDLEEKVMSRAMSPETRDALAAQSLEFLDALVAEDPGFGTAWAWRGRVLDLLGRWDAAAADLDRGCVAAPDDAAVWFLRGTFRLRLYRHLRGATGGSLGPAGIEIEVAHEETPREKSLREGGLDDLARMIAAAARDAQFGEEELRLGRAAAAIDSAAPEGCEDALRLVEGIERPAAWKTRGLALYRLRRFDEAVEAFSRVLERWPNDETTWLHRGDARFAAEALRWMRGDDPRAGLERAVADYDEALRLNPNYPVTYDARGIARCILGQAQAAQGGDPCALYRAAKADFGEALRRDPQDPGALNNRCCAALLLADFATEHGGDPGDEVRSACADADRDLQARPNSSRAYELRANARRRLARMAASAGGDPRDELRRSVEDADRALAIDPNAENGWFARAAARLDLGEWEAPRGIDAREDFRGAAGDYAEAVRCEPNSLPARTGRAASLSRLGTAEAGRGQDPRAIYREAAAEFEEALRLSPGSVELRVDAGVVWSLIGEADAARGEEPGESFRRSLALLDEALARNPTSTIALTDRGGVRVEIGRAESARGQDPRGFYRLAVVDCDAALRIDPSRLDAFLNRGNAWRYQGETEAALGADAEESFGKADADYRAGIARGHAPAFQNLALLERSRGRFEESAAAIDAAVKAFPTMADWGRAQLEENHREQREAARAEPWEIELRKASQLVHAGNYAGARPHYEKGFALFDEAPAPSLGPGSREALWNAHYDFACILALAFTGHGKPQTVPQPVDPATAAHERDLAFVHLRNAVEIGYADRAHLAADADLAALHADPRWTALLDAMKK